MSGYFELLGLPERFVLAPDEIERAYLERSKETHPDRFATAPAGERLAAVQRSVEVQDAYRTLKKPVRRAEYLLARGGLTIGDNERIADGAFLMQILELREELGDARAAGRTEEVARLQAKMQAHHRTLVAGLAPAFERGDLPKVKQLLIELRYVDRYLEECDVALDEDAA
jgi:molecular chaperone HscB